MGKNASKPGNRLSLRRGRRGSVTPAGGPTTAPEMTAQTAVLTLKVQRSEVQKYKLELVSRQLEETQIIKQLVQSGKMESAKLLLKKQKFHTYLVEESERQLESILRQCEADDITIGQKIDESQAARGVEKGGEALKQIRLLMELDNLDKILEESEESIQKQRELDRVILLSAGVEDPKFLDSLKAVEKEVEEMKVTEAVAAEKAEPEEDLLHFPEPEKVELQLPQDPNARIPEEIAAEINSKGGVPPPKLEQTEVLSEKIPEQPKPLEPTKLEEAPRTSATATEASSSVSSNPSKEENAYADRSNMTAAVSEIGKNFSKEVESELEFVTKKSQVILNNELWKELGLGSGKNFGAKKEVPAGTQAEISTSSGVALKGTDEVSHLLLPDVPSSAVADEQ
ncbi:unnamed protein product [Orchesella dallaii]|uniref:Charged multivesicular body protein 6 n=1 Tax=Orchesella dallaii TaxID=48710 RepID=A0ABP1S1S8_9HEXA